MPGLRKVVPGESWADLCKVVFGVWFLVWVYAALHDLYLIRIYPEHFTVWHYKMPFLEDHTLLAIAYALGASVTPGLVLGVVLYAAGRLFDRPKLSPKSIVLSTIWVFFVVEACAIAMGLVAWGTQRAVYPDWIYPEDSPAMFITQTIQVTAYLVGAVCSVILIGWTWHRRKV